MMVVTPRRIEAADLTSNVPIDDAAAWEPGTYNEDDVVVHLLQVWEAQTTTTAEPGTNSVEWVRLGWLNRFRMFRDGEDSKTTAEGNITVTLDTGEVFDTIGLLGLVGNSVTVKQIDPIEGTVKDETIQILDIGAGDWWEWHFLDYDQTEEVVFDLFPFPDAEIEVSIDAVGTSPVAAGRVIVGTSRDLGITLHGTSVSALNSSIRQRDGFGNLVLVPRRSVKLTDYEVDVPKDSTTAVRRVLDRLSSMPTLFIGDRQRGATIVFGIVQDFRIIYTNPTYSGATITVEGF